MKITDTGKAGTQRRVLYVDLREKKSKRPKRSPVIADLRVFDRRSSAGAERLAEAALKGIQHYRKERAPEDGKRGRLMRIPLDLAKAMVAGMEEAEGVGEDARKAISARRTRAEVRRRLG